MGALKPVVAGYGADRGGEGVQLRGVTLLPSWPASMSASGSRAPGYCQGPIRTRIQLTRCESLNRRSSPEKGFTWALR